MSVPPRRHRLPQRLDWKLIPAPLDLSKPLVDDKAALPAIIVTPSSPTHSRDFQIAFLAPTPQEETFRERVFSRLNKSSNSNTRNTSFPQFNFFKPRTLILLFIPIFLLFCHVLVHRLAAHHAHFHFDVYAHGGHAGAAGGVGEGWFDLNDYREARHARELIIEERFAHPEQ